MAFNVCRAAAGGKHAQKIARMLPPHGSREEKYCRRRTAPRTAVLARGLCRAL